MSARLMVTLDAMAASLALATCRPQPGTPGAIPESSVSTVLETPRPADVEHLVSMRLTELTGTTCFLSSHSSGPPPDVDALDRAISEAAVDTGLA